MKILIYADPASRRTDSQLEAIHKLVPYPTQLTTSHTAFQEAFGHCLSGETIVVFFVNSDSDLDLLEGMEKTFVDTKLLLAMAGPNDHLLRRAYRCSPRLVAQTDERPVLLPMTIQGMANEMNRNN